MRIRGEGVDTSQVRIDPDAPTGVFFRERREAQSRPIEVVYYRRGSAASRLSVADLDAEYIATARFVHLTGITPALSASCRETTFAAAAIARGAGVPVVLDPNYRSKLWAPDEARRVLSDLAGHCDLLLAGLDEAELLTGEPDPETAARQLAARGPATVVVKLGGQGALAIDGERVIRAAAAPLERVVDPVGAGDAFVAGLLAGRLRELTIEEALQLANRCGAQAMTAPGDMEALPLWQEVAGPAPTTDVSR